MARLPRCTATWLGLSLLFCQVSLTSATIRAFANVTTTSPPSTITSAATTSAACATCQLAANPRLALYIWYTETISLTMDTISPYVVQYNNTRITMTSTIYGNLSTISASDVPEMSPLVSLFSSQPVYSLTADFIDGTTSAYSSGTYTTTLVYPDSYANYDVIHYNNTEGECVDVALFRSALAFDPGSVPYVTFSQPIFASVEPITDFASLIEAADSGELCPSSMYSAPLAAMELASALGPELAGCVSSICSGPPVFKVPVSVLTSTVTGGVLSTVTSTGMYSIPTTSPSPQSTATPPTPTRSSSETPAPTSSEISDSQSQSSTPTKPSSSEYSESPTLSSQSPSSDYTESQTPTNSPPLSSSTDEPSTATVSQSSQPDSLPSSPSTSLETSASRGGQGSLPSASTNPITPSRSSIVTQGNGVGSTEVGGTTYYTVGSQTLIPGSSGVVVSGTTYSLTPSGSSVIVAGGSGIMSTLTAVAPDALGSTQSGGTTYYTVGTQTLTPGGPDVVVSGTTYSLVPSGSSVVIVAGGSTTTSALNGITPSPYFKIGAHTLSAGGSPIVASGTTYSLDSSGTGVVVIVAGSTSTISINTATPTLVIGSTTYTESIETSATDVGSISTGYYPSTAISPPPYTGDAIALSRCGSAVSILVVILATILF